MAREKKSKKTASEISNCVERQVVEVSLQHPGYDAHRLVPLLKQEGITVTTSAVNTILKRNNLQNRSLRLAKLEEQTTPKIVVEPTNVVEPSPEVLAPVPLHTSDTKPECPITETIKLPPKTGRSPWSLSPVNILLLGLVGYFWVSALGNLLEARREPVLPHYSPSVAVESKRQISVRPLEDYNIISERNLFGGSKAKGFVPQEEVSLEGQPVSMKVLGLKLVGTVVGDDAAMSLAIIDNQSTRKQELYHEGDQVGQALLKKILRNKVVLNTGSGDEVLTMELEEGGQGPMALQRQMPGQLPEIASSSNPAEREGQNSAFFDLDEFMQQVQISSYMRGEEPAGATITGNSKTLARLRLRNGDVIMGMNGQAITDPDQAREVFEKAAKGKQVTLHILRQNRPRKIRIR